MASEPHRADDPLPAFHFRVSFADGPDSIDSSFQEVSGIGPELKTEEYVEGGENRFVHRLPTSVQHPELELKRGVAPLDSPLIKWCREIFEGDLVKPIETQNLTVALLNEERQPVRSWSFADAYPTKWETEGFNSTKNEVAIEKIVLSYTFSNRVV